MNLSKTYSIVQIVLTLIVCSGLAGCAGRSSISQSTAEAFSSSPESTANNTALPTNSTVPTAVVDDGETPLPVFTMPVKVNGLAWTLPQPEGVEPLVAANSAGVLWVRFPAMLTTESTRRYGMPAFAEEAYTLLWTPWRPEGGDLEQGAREVGTLSSITVDGNQTISILAPAGDNRFWLGTYTLPANAQNGGTYRVLQVDPETSGIHELLQVRGEGGGHHARMAYNSHWLFWNSIDTDASRGEALLLDLVTGEQRSLDLGGNNWTTAAEWDDSGQLGVTRADNGARYSVDPTSGNVESAR